MIFQRLPGAHIGRPSRLARDEVLRDTRSTPGGTTQRRPSSPLLMPAWETFPSSIAAPGPSKVGYASLPEVRSWHQA